MGKDPRCHGRLQRAPAGESEAARASLPGARTLGRACAEPCAVPWTVAAVTSTPVPGLEFVTFLLTFAEDVLVSELPREVESGFPPGPYRCW